MFQSGAAEQETGPPTHLAYYLIFYFRCILAIATQCFSATTPCEVGVIVPLAALVYIRQPSYRVEEIPDRMMVI